MDFHERDGLRRVVHAACVVDQRLVAAEGVHRVPVALRDTFLARVRKSREHVSCAFDLLLHRLQEPDACVRLRALSLVEALLARSPLFRALLAVRFQHVAALLLGTVSPLPPPLKVSQQLQRRAASAIARWARLYGPRHPQLRAGLQYLQTTHRSLMQAASSAERQQTQARRRHQR